MKQLSYPYLILLISIFFYYGCQTDDKQTENYTTNEVISKKISLDEFASKTGAAEKLQKLLQEKKNRTQARGVTTGRLYDFNIVGNEVLMIQKGDYSSYTFPITRIGDASGLSENLVLSKQKDGSYTAALIKYFLTEKEKESLESHGMHTMEGRVKVIGLDVEKINTPMMSSRVLKYCLTWTYLICNYGGEEHIAGKKCTRISGTRSFTACYSTEEDYWDNSFTKPQFPGYIDEGGGGGGGAPNPEPDPDADPEDPTITGPILNHPNDNPCSQLNKLKAATDYTHVISELEGKALGPKEFGWGYKFFPNSTTFAPPTVVGNSTVDPTKVDLSALTGIEWLGVFHNHTDPTSTRAVQMFSPGDVEWLLIKGFKRHRYSLTNNTAPRFSELFVGLVVQNGVYCLKIKDWAKFSRFMSPAIFQTFKKNLEDLNIKDTPTAPKESQERTLLKMLTKYDMGIGLYEQGEQEIWNELELDPLNNENPPKKTPCN